MAGASVSIPDKLVGPAATALCLRHFGAKNLNKIGVRACDTCEEKAAEALAAAFAALPECGEVKRSMSGESSMVWCNECGTTACLECSDDHGYALERVWIVPVQGGKS